MRDRKILKIILTLFLAFNISVLSAFSSVYATENDLMITETVTESESVAKSETIPESETITESETIIESETITENENASETQYSNDEKRDVELDFTIIGEGDVTILDEEGNSYVMGEGTESIKVFYPKDCKLKIKASVRDENRFIYCFYIKEGDNTPVRESVTGKGYVHEAELTICESTEVLIVFANVHEKEIVFKNPLNDSVESGIQTFAIGDIGQNWGMYNLFTAYTVISELGSNTEYPYSHIIQVDANHDYVYEDVTYTAYCIEYGRECPSGGYLTETALTTSQMDYLGYALAYGWRQNVTHYDESLYNDSYASSEIAVTQGIIWCCTKGIFNTASGDAAMTKIINATHQPSHARIYYNDLKTTILNVDTKPSFDGSTIILEWNSVNNRYEATVSDSNGMLSYYDYSSSGISFSKSGNDLTIYTTNEYPNGINAQAMRVVLGGSNAVKTWNAWNGKQDMATYVDYSRNVASTITLKTKAVNGSLSLKKTSSNVGITNNNDNYSLEGAKYGVYTDSNCTKNTGTLTTTASGISNTLSLVSGTYYVKETTASKGYALDPNTYKVTVSGGNTTELEVKETPITGYLTIKKQSGDPSFAGSPTDYSDLSATFHVYNASNEHIGTVKTDDSGNGTLSGLAIGNYTVKEIIAPTGYVLNSSPQAFAITSAAPNVTKTFLNDPKLGKIILTKTIHAGDINFDNGNPMFTFKLTGTDVRGEQHTYYRIVDFTEVYVDANTDSQGDVSITAVFDQLVAGEYEAFELESSRYSLEAICNIENGLLNDNKVAFSLKTDGSMEGKATFINDNYEQQNYSDTEKVINELKK